MEEADHLRQIMEKIRQRIAGVEETLEEGKREIDSMQDYYWLNYTEMDQYGYEDYDNQQALLHQLNANREQAKLRRRFRRMLDSPYFGRVDFCYAGEPSADPYYIGIGNFAERAGQAPLIYDWRAPVCSLFYDYDSGPASYEAPSGTIEGEITLKRQYKIRGGKLIYAFESDTKIDDEILREELGAGGDVKLKNIVRTIQREQNAIIRNRTDRILVIQGAAGSGKTSIALHRIAYLLYHDRENLKSSDILILSPNSVFSDYISQILPELGEENIREMSFDLFAYRELKSAAADCEDRCDYLERQMRAPDPAEQKRFHEKQSERFLGLMEGFAAMLEEELVELRDVEYRGLKKTETELIQLFYFKFQNIPLLKRMDAVMEYFVDEYETLRGTDLSEEELLLVREKFHSMYTTEDIYEIYSRMLVFYGYEPLADAEYARRRVLYEDVFPMLYLKYRLGGQTRWKQIRHLVIDEMQDYSYLQYVILAGMFDCRMTILGDRAQTLDSEPHDVLKFLPGIFGKQMRKVILERSYRSTVEIADYAAGLSKAPLPKLLKRHGQPVREEQLPDAEALAEFVADVTLKEEQGRRVETGALLVMTEREASELFQILKEKMADSAYPVHYVDRNTSAFVRGLTVTTYYLAKGLEFDRVFFLKGDPSDPFAAQAAYISATRALHELYVCEYSGIFSV